MRIRTILVAGALAAVGLLPATSQAAGVAVYSIKGQITVTPVSKEGPGSWTISGTPKLKVAGAPTTRVMTKVNGSGTLRALPATQLSCECGIATGKVTLTWSRGLTSEVLVAHVMNHPYHELSGMIRSGYASNSIVTIIVRHNATGGFTGNLLVGLISPSM